MRANLLAISGGGIRGIIPALIIARLEKSQPFLDKIHMVGGTSTGSIIACAIASKKVTVEEIAAMYEKDGPAIFQRTLLDQLRTVFGLYKTRYSSDGLHKLLKAFFGDLRMRDLPMKVLVPALDIGSEKRGMRAKFFDNYKDSPDLDLFVRDVVIASCSGPTYFPAHKIEMRGEAHYFLDGGTFCNHPAMSLIASARDPLGLNAQATDIACLSVTTGYFPRNALGWAERGVVGWLDDVFEVLQEQYSTVVFQAEKVLYAPLESRFMAINPPLAVDVKFDDYKKVGVLKETADLSDGAQRIYLDWIRRNFVESTPSLRLI